MPTHATRNGFGDAKEQRGMTSTVMPAANPGLDPSRTRDLYGDVLRAACCHKIADPLIPTKWRLGFYHTPIRADVAACKPMARFNDLHAFGHLR